MEAEERGDVATAALEGPEQAGGGAGEAAAAAAAPLVAVPQAGEVVAASAPQEALDPTMVATHSYLGGKAQVGCGHRCQSARAPDPAAVLCPC